jgi:hypothetical protein
VHDQTVECNSSSTPQQTMLLLCTQHGDITSQSTKHNSGDPKTVKRRETPAEGLWPEALKHETLHKFSSWFGTGLVAQEISRNHIEMKSCCNHHSEPCEVQMAKY